MSYLDNDDDLFDYDPDLENTSNPIFNESSSPKPNSQFETFVSKEKIDEDLDISSNTLLDESKIKLALAFHQATHRHFSSVETSSYLKSMTLVLDKLTDGHFSLIYMFYKKESVIAQRILFLSMMDLVTEFPEDSSKNVLAELCSHLGIQIDKLHVDLYYSTSIAICRHSLATDRVIYQHLGEKLSIPINQSLVDPTYKYNDDSSKISDILSSDIYTKIFSSITDSLAQEGLLEKLQETFGTPVKLFKNV